VRNLFGSVTKAPAKLIPLIRMLVPRTQNESVAARVCARLALALSCGLALSADGAQIASFADGGTGWQMGTLAVGNLDGSPDLEIVVPYRDSAGSWFVDAFKFNGKRLPGFPYSAGGDPVNVSPTLYDLDGDGRDEIIFTRGNHVIALHGDGTVMWSNTVDAASYVPNGGYQTVTNGFYWWPTGAWLDHLPSSAVFSSEVSSPVVMDLDGTGKLEVVTAWKIQPDPLAGGQDFNPFIFPIFGVGPWGAMGENWSGGVVTFEATTGRQTFVYHLHHLVESGLAVGRANPSGALNIYALNDSDSVVAFDKTRPFGLWGKGMLHGQFGRNLRLMSGSYQVPIDIYTADIDGDGLDEVLVAGTQLGSLWQPNETILDDNGGILWRRWLPHVDMSNNSGWLNSACLIPVNPDHDNHVDVLGWNHSSILSFRYWNGIELVDRTGWPKDFSPLLPTPPVVGDVDGDGLEEILVGTYDPTGLSQAGELLVYSLDGMLKQSVPVPGGIKQVPALADVEGIGRIDVVCRSVTGQIYVWNFGSTTTNLVSWATARGNMRRDGNCNRSLYPDGTPMVNFRASGFNRTSFGWTNSATPSCYRIFRADQADGPFVHVATVEPGTTSFTDVGLRPGWQYFYEVGAVFPAHTVLSAPFAILSGLNGNLLANPGFERDDNCCWDKWSSDTAGVTNICVSTNVAYQGLRSMCVLLQNQAAGSSVAENIQYGIPDPSMFVTPGAYYSFGGFFKSSGMSAPSENWLEWSSTKTGWDTNERPILPDPFYYTPHFSAAQLPVDWSYVNRTFQMPRGFPNVEIRHRYTVTGGVATGSLYLDNLFFRQIPNPGSAAWTTLVPFGAWWRYSTNTVAPDWPTPGFDVSAWPFAKAKFGAGSGPTNISTLLPQRLPNYFFRTQFNLASTNLEELLLAATCTDVDVQRIYPLQIYLNGQAVAATVDAVTMQGNETRYFDLLPFAPSLRPGTNTLAIRIGNTWSDYDDIAFDVCLRTVISGLPVPGLRADFSAPGSPRLVAQTPQGTIWQIESCDALGGPWQPILSFTNSDGTAQALLLAGRGRPGVSGSSGSRFYRLAPWQGGLSTPIPVTRPARPVPHLPAEAPTRSLRFWPLRARM